MKGVHFFEKGRIKGDERKRGGRTRYMQHRRTTFVRGAQKECENTR